MSNHSLETFGGPRVLVADDDPLVRRMIARSLRGTVLVSLVGSVQDGKRLVQSLARWSAFLFDVNLGDGLGWELLDAVREHAHYAHTPAIMMSATDYADAPVRAAAQGALFVPKTFTPAELRTIVRAALPPTT